jgi:hypothetical protein
MVIMRLSTISSLYASAGPWASVYLDATGTQKTGTPQEARHQLDLRWRAARESLHRAGADEATLRAIDEAVRQAPATGRPAEVAVLASHGAVALSRTLPVTPGREAASWSAQPHAADLLRALGGLGSPGTRGPQFAPATSEPELIDEIRWVRADVDRTGGSVISHDGATDTLRGEDEFITKVSTGGRARRWSMPRIQRAAEVNWDRNSGDVARALVAAVERVDADVVVLAGDVRARQLVRDRLPPALAARVVEVDHELPVRPHPGSRLRARREPAVHDPVLNASTREAVDAAVRQRRFQAADKFHSGLSSGESVRGLGPVCDAARQLRIETLVLGPEPSHRQAWVDPLNPTMVGESRRETGSDLAVPEPADDALVGAAAVAGADGVIIIEADAELVDGLGAILRYPDESARHHRRIGSHDDRRGGPVIG